MNEFVQCLDVDHTRLLNFLKKIGEDDIMQELNGRQGGVEAFVLVY